MAALQLAAHVFPDWATSPPTIVLALLVGLAGALAARFIQRLALRLGGFLSGVVLALSAVQWSGANLGLWTWAAAFGVGLIGSLLAIWAFGGALVLLSSAAGAGLIAVNLELSSSLALGVFLGALMVGVAVQTGFFRRVGAALSSGT